VRRNPALGILGTVVDYLLGGPKVGGPDEERLRRWFAVSAQPPGLPHAHARYVVVDTETTGLDLKRDRVISIGAAGVDRGVLRLADCFEVVLRQERASPDANILIHRIGGEAQLAGVEPKQGVLAFLEFTAKSPLVAFRAEFDRTMLARAVKSVLGVPFHHPWIDLAVLLPALFAGTEANTLDDWIDHFGLPRAGRHHALADAFATAQLLQIVLAAADRVGMGTAADLIAIQRAQVWLGKR
jgi:DNA polymerase III subunit epsilon